MKFEYEINQSIEDKGLFYDGKEHSFNMKVITKGFDFELMLNKLSMSVKNTRIIQLWGFCGLGEWMKSSIEIPQYERGYVRVINNFQKGLVYSLNKEELPVQINTSSGWVCIGDPNFEKAGIEFIRNCVIFLDDGKIKSLWLKPASLPSLVKRV